MKKFLLLILMAFSLTLVGCLETANKTYTFNRDNPQPIRITYSGEITSFTIVGSNINKSLSKDTISNYIDNNVLLLDYSFFSTIDEGTYSITIIADKEINFNVKLIGDLYKFNYINKSDIFTIDMDKYYVLFTKENCSSCEKIMSEAKEFNDFLQTYPLNTVPVLYLVNCSNQEPSLGTNDVLTGLDNYDDLINNAKITTPTIVTIENGIITSYYVGYSNVTTFINLEINNISKKKIIHNIDDPKIIKIKLDFTPKKYSIISSDGKKTTYTVTTGTYSNDTTIFDNGIMYFTTYFFNSKLPGDYTLTFYNENDEQSIDLYIRSTFNYISVYDLFDKEDSKYYVFFLRDGCPACNKVKPTLLEYAKTYQNYNNGTNPQLYAVHESQHSASIYSKDENFIGVSSLDDLRIGYFPRVILIENGVITNVYIGYDNITELFLNLLK